MPNFPLQSPDPDVTVIALRSISNDILSHVSSLVALESSRIIQATSKQGLH
jgi:hypothetical protein